MARKAPLPAVSSGRAAATSAVTLTAPNNRVIRQRRGAGLMVLNMALPSQATSVLSISAGAPLPRT